MKLFIIKKKSLAFIALIIAFFVISVPIFSFNVLPVLSKKRELPIYRVNTEEKAIAISFDCAWGTDYTLKLLETMKSENINCTFFAVEFWVEKYPDTVKKIVEYGNEMGTHSATHPHMKKLSESDIKKELFSSMNAIEKITGEKVTLFRAPFGEYDDRVINIAKSFGLYTIQWDVDSLDWKNISSTEIENRVIKKVKNGSIVLFHNQGLHTSESLKNIIKTLKNEGYVFKKISQLIYKENYNILPDGSQVKN